MARLKKPLVWGSIGAAVAYLCDPDRGKGRRARLKDQAAAAVRRAGARLRSRGRYLEGQVHGISQRVTQARDDAPENDRTLVDKVRSEVLGRPEYAGRDVLVEAADGVVTLRGQVESPDEANELEAAVRKVAGVRDVTNLLHPPEAPAPNKEASLEAS